MSSSFFWPIPYHLYITLLISFSTKSFDHSQEKWDPWQDIFTNYSHSYKMSNFLMFVRIKLRKWIFFHRRYQTFFLYSSFKALLSQLQLMVSTSLVWKTLIEQDLVTMPISDYSLLFLPSMLHFRIVDSLCLVFLPDLPFAYQGMHTRLARMN